MLILPRSCFLHVPKTGGSWAKEAISAAGISCRHYPLSGNPHIGLKDCPCPEKFKFAFVRHPVDLYRSYWQYKMTNGWDTKNQMDQECQTDNFHQFVQNLVDRFPGVYSHSLIEMVGEENNEIEFIGKYENLVDDLIIALKLAGEEFNEQAIRTLSPVNVSDKTRFPAVYTDRLEAEVKKAEAKMMKRFHYE